MVVLALAAAAIGLPVTASYGISYENRSTAAGRSSGATYSSGSMYFRLYDGENTNEYQLSFSWNGNTPSYASLTSDRKVNVAMTLVSGGEGKITADLARTQYTTSVTRHDGAVSTLSQYLSIELDLNIPQGYIPDPSYGGGSATTREVRLLTSADDSGISAGQTATPVFAVSAQPGANSSSAYDETGKAYIKTSAAAVGLMTFHSSATKKYWRINNEARDLYFTYPEEASYDFSYEQRVPGVEFDSFAADEKGEGIYSRSLTDGEWILFPGLDRGAGYQVTEEDPGRFSPSYFYSQGGGQLAGPFGQSPAGLPLATQNEQLAADTAVDFVNVKEEPEGTDLLLRKKLAGDRITQEDRDRAFEFRFRLRGLDPELTYKVRMERATGGEVETEEDMVIVPEADGSAAGTISLRDGDLAVIADLPSGAGYALAEVTEGMAAATGEGEYAIWFEVTEGADTTVCDYRYFPAEEVGSMAASGQVAAAGPAQTGQTVGYETIEEGKPVEYTFVNSRFAYHDLTIGKQRTEDGSAKAGADGEDFHIKAELSGLEPGKSYGASGGSIQADETGRCLLDLVLRHGEEYTVRDLPGSARCSITEDPCDYIPSLEVARGEEKEISEPGIYGQGLEGSLSGLDQDTKVTVINEKPQHADLSVTKEYDGLYDETGVLAEFSVYLTGLEKNRSYAVQRLTEDGTVIEEDEAVSDDEGESVFRFLLKDRQTMRILQLPSAATAVIEEEGREGVLPSFVMTSDDTGDVREKSGSAAEGEKLRTGRERMTVDRSFSFYNEIPSRPVKTVTDKDKITRQGEGEETEVDENMVPALTSGWSYHISQEIPVPVADFKLVDTLPAYVRATVMDPSAGEEDAPLRVFWHSPDGSTSWGGPVTDRDKETGEYFVRSEDGRILFTIIYDRYAEDDRSRLTVITEDADMLLQGGRFDLYFDVNVDRAAARNDLVQAGEYDGSFFRFVNDAVTSAGSYVCETNPVTTYIPESRELSVEKKVRAAEGLKEEGRTFPFRASFSRLIPGEKYLVQIPAVIRAGLVLDSDGLSLKASDETGRKYTDITATVYVQEDHEVAVLKGQRSVSLPPGEYRVEFCRGEIRLTDQFEIREGPGGPELTGKPLASFCDGGEELEFEADEKGKALVPFELADGQKAQFQGLPDDVLYEIEEKTPARYIPEWTVLSGAGAGGQTAAEEGQAGENLSTGRNVYYQGEGTLVLYTNTRQMPAVRIIKTDDDGAPVEGAWMLLYRGGEEAAVSEGMTHLEQLPDQDPVYEWTTDGEGQHPDEVSENIRDGYLPLLPGEYTLIEGDAPEGSSLQLARPVHIRINEDGSHQIRDPEKEEYGLPYDETIPMAVIDHSMAATDLILEKEVAGNLGDRTKEFEFTVKFTGLEAEKTYQSPADPAVPAPVRAYTADPEGEAVLQVKLKDGESVCFPALPYGASWRIREAASDHRASYRITAGSGRADIARPEDSNGRLTGLSLATAEERTGREEERVRVTFINSRELGVITGVPAHWLFWLIVLGVILSALCLRLTSAVRRR